MIYQMMFAIITPALISGGFAERMNFSAFVLFNLVITKPTGTMNFRTFSEILFNFRLTPPLVLGGLAFSLAMGFIGGFFPAARAARLKITTALREI